jgi:hypothetical protein
MSKFCAIKNKMFEIGLQPMRKMKKVFFPKLKNMKKDFASPDQSRLASLLSIRRIGSGYQSADLIPSLGVKAPLLY